MDRQLGPLEFVVANITHVSVTVSIERDVFPIDNVRAGHTKFRHRLPCAVDSEENRGATVVIVVRPKNTRILPARDNAGTFSDVRIADVPDLEDTRSNGARLEILRGLGTGIGGTSTEQAQQGEND